MQTAIPLAPSVSSTPPPPDHLNPIDAMITPDPPPFPSPRSVTHIDSPPLVHPADNESPSQPAGSMEEWVKPSPIQVIRRNPKDITYLLCLFMLWVGTTSGWVVFMVKKAKSLSNQDGMGQIFLLIDAVFILALLILTFLIVRQVFYLGQYFSPPSNQTSQVPGWLLPRLPSYVDAVGRAQATGDVEDRWIVGEGLPKYGDNRGSTLLLRSLSRGGVPSINTETTEREGGNLSAETEHDHSRQRDE
ncbi:hypothetical protein M231_00076 [Tremella mesenterica]|uniref:Uncharacterized protein n=1 Tax=Tremella mesenterica TaxID=5217 RepID=A0A4Q1BWP1_TREME|nr:hypothetical protein M231_00076 [Tremella mesenterica]